ncbi:MAG: HupE/UreJ family protein [Polyangiaceae bacterium]
MTPRRALAAVVVAITVLLSHGAALAHPTPGSTVFVDLTVDGARIEQSVPIEELERALHVQLAEEGDDAARIVERSADRLRTYASEHVELRAGDRAWRATVQRVRGEDAADGPRAVFELVVAADGAVDAAVVLHDDLVAHEVVSHYATVYVRSDWSVGALASEPRDPKLAGTIHAGRFDVPLRDRGGFGRGFASVVGAGARHIAEGTDHLLFLFALVLVAPVCAVGGRWRGARSGRETAAALARVVSAFTLGHSLTLVLGACGVVALPARLVEATVALSIVVAAVHAIRPLLPRREAIVAASFGLVHGLAFASTLPTRQLGAAQTGWTLLGFNLGIELAQLGLLLLVLPWLLLLASTPRYAAFRLVSAAITLALALGWLAERALSLANPTAFIARGVERHPLVALGTLAALAIGARITSGSVAARAAALPAAAPPP